MKVSNLLAGEVISRKAISAKPNLDLLEKLFKLHQPMLGDVFDAYPSDKIYCSRCREKVLGPSEYWPCKTLKAAGFEITSAGRAEIIKRLAGGA